MNDIISIVSENWMLLLVGQYPHGPMGGLVLTLILSVVGLALAFPVSVLLALARISPFPWIRLPATTIVYMVRGVPLIMFIFWVYFFLPLLTGRTVSGTVTMLITLVIYQAAYLSESIRAGIEGLPRGQVEASRALGMSYLGTMSRIVLPQALYNMLPAMVSQFISTIKETSLGYVISVNELTFSANQINAALLTKPFPVFMILAAIYFVLCFTLSQLARRLEARIAGKRAGRQKAHPVPMPTVAHVVTK
ncbi:MAG: amino acid ABC transporter permease [Herbaspirillum sp.]|nr:amino acid ABC transporter permease [Herbaspirillum sp.]